MEKYKTAMPTFVSKFIEARRIKLGIYRAGFSVTAENQFYTQILKFHVTTSLTII